MTDDSHCDSIRSSLTAVHGYVGKQPVDMEEYCAEYCLKERQESMDRCTGHGDIPEILLKMTLNTLQSINQSINKTLCSQMSAYDAHKEKSFWKHRG